MGFGPVKEHSSQDWLQLAQWVGFKYKRLWTMIDNDDGYKVTFGAGELQMIMVMALHPEKS